jgi:PAS domain S-box-containing protein
MFYGIVQDITRRKQAEEKLRAATEQFRVVAQVTNDAIWDWDLATDKLSWNEGVQTLFGYSPEQVSDSIAWWYEHIHPDDRDAVVEGIHEVIDAGGQQWSDEYRFVKEDGTFADVLDRGFILHDSSGKPVRMLGGMTDMTERRIAEEKLRESEEKFRDLADNISQLAWMAEASGSIFWYNERWYEYTGTTLAEMQGWGWQKVHHPDYVEHVTKSFKQSVDAGEAWEDTFPLRSKTGEYRWFLSRALPIRDADGKIIRWFGTNTDVTEIRNTRRELEEANALLDTLFDQAPIGFGYWDENLRFSRVNRALAEMNGFSVEEHLGKTVADLLPEVAEGVTEAFRHVVRTGEALINLEAEGKTPADLDEYRYWNVSYYPINLEGKIAGVGAVCEEITERKKAEVEREKLLASEQEARREAEQANRLKDEFLATVSHELRTPLNAILGWATIARQGGYKPEMMRSAFEIVERNARNQEQIIADILDVSRIITGKLNIEVESVELVSVVKAAIDTVRPTIEAKRINLAADFADQAQFVKGDPDRLQQIVWNLLSNAAKFTPEGGTVFVSLRRHEQFAEICVQDTGKGIEPEFLPFVFDRFRQAEGGSNRTHGGLGLGLSIVRHLVELHGGSVLVQSEGKNRGAKFVVMLPLFTSALSKESDGDISEIFESDRNQNNFPTAVNSNKLAGLYILAVDDEPDALELLKLMLETEGAVVTTAVSAAEALEKLQNAEFDVLISDLGMPGEDGFDLIRKIKSSNRYTKIPAIAVTAYARDEDSRRAVEAGFSAHLPKPVNGEDLTAMLRNLITN